jgi:outer membrane protein assembly factor BamE
MKLLGTGLLGAICLLATACMHVPEIQQGTIITPEMVDQLKPGMTRNQVKFVMGTPTITNPFRQNRWDYIYTLNRDGVEVQRRHLALFFEGDKLVEIADDNPDPSPAAETSINRSTPMLPEGPETDASTDTPPG